MALTSGKDITQTHILYMRQNKNLWKISKKYCKKLPEIEKNC